MTDELKFAQVVIDIVTHDQARGIDTGGYLDRAVRAIAETTGCSEERAAEALHDASVLACLEHGVAPADWEAGSGDQ